MDDPRKMPAVEANGGWVMSTVERDAWVNGG